MNAWKKSAKGWRETALAESYAEQDARAAHELLDRLGVVRETCDWNPHNDAEEWRNMTLAERIEIATAPQEGTGQ
jgi:hypothetical protein